MLNCIVLLLTALDLCWGGARAAGITSPFYLHHQKVNIAQSGHIGVTIILQGNSECLPLDVKEAAHWRGHNMHDTW